MAKRRVEIFLEDNCSDSDFLSKEFYNCSNLSQSSCKHFEYNESTSKVRRYNLNEGVMIAIQYYGKSLENWLDMEGIIFDPGFLRHGVKAPTERVKMVIRKFIKSVVQDHEKGYFLGFLKHKENIGIDNPSNKCFARRNINDFKVTLCPRVTKSEETNQDPVEGMDSDLLAVADIIFKLILIKDRDKPDATYDDIEFAPEVLDLKDKLEKGYNLSGYKENVANLIKSHPMLWDLRVKMYYYEKVWERYENEEVVAEKSKMEEAMEKMLDKHFTRLGVANPSQRTFERGDWRDMVKDLEGPLGKIYKENNYGPSGKELTRFGRITYSHIRKGNERTWAKKVFTKKKKRYVRTDVVSMYEYKYFTTDEADNAEPRYIETQMNNLFPYMRCDLHAELYAEGIFI